MCVSTLQFLHYLSDFSWDVCDFKRYSTVAGCIVCLRVDCDRRPWSAAKYGVHVIIMLAYTQPSKYNQPDKVDLHLRLSLSLSLRDSGIYDP